MGGFPILQNRAQMNDPCSCFLTAELQVLAQRGSSQRFQYARPRARPPFADRLPSPRDISITRVPHFFDSVPTPSSFTEPRFRRPLNEDLFLKAFRDLPSAPQLSSPLSPEFFLA